MRKFGPLLLVVVVALLVTAAFLLLRSGPTDLSSAGPSTASHGHDDGKPADAASATTPSSPERVADLPAAASIAQGPNSVRGLVRFAADGRPAAGAKVRAFSEKPPLRPMKIAQEFRRAGAGRKPAQEQDLSDFGANFGGSDHEEAGSAVVDDADEAHPEDGKKPEGEGAPPTQPDANAEAGAHAARHAAMSKETPSLGLDSLITTTTARADGSFELAGLAQGVVFVDAITGDTRSENDERVSFATGPSHEGVVLSLVPAARLRGHVHDEEGRVVAGATITLTIGFDPFSVFASGGLEMNRPASAKSDAQGAFSFEGVAAPRSLQVQVSAEGFAHAPSQKIELRAGDDRTVDLLLAHGATVVVHVTDGSGAPVVGAQCRLEPTRIDLQNIQSDAVRSFGNRLDADAEGRARFTGVAAGEWRARATHPERCADSKNLTVAGPGTEQQIEVVLTKGRTLAGVVVARDGTPVAGATVSAFVEPSLMNFSSMAHAGERRWKKADDQGRFTLDGLPDGKLLCEAKAKGYRNGRVNVDKDATECRVELSTHGIIEGVVVSKKTGKPVTRFDLKVARERKLTNFMDPEAAAGFIDVNVPIATPNGTFRLIGVNPGRLRLFVQAPEHGESATDWLDIVEGETKRGVVVFLEREAVIEGIVVEAGGGEPVAGASVRRDAGGNPIEAMMAQMFRGDDLQSDAKGHFRIGGLASGVARFVAVKEGFVDATSGDLELVAGETLANVRLELSRGGEIWGVVADPAGAPVAGASVMCQDTVRFKMTTQKSDDKGEYRFKGLAAGNFSLTKMPDKFDLGQENFIAEMTNSIETHTVKLKAGETQRVDFLGKKGGGATVSGRVTQGGSPVGGAFVTVMANPGNDSAGATDASAFKSATTAADGTFEVGGLPAGSGFVQVNAADFMSEGGASAALQTLSLVDGQTTRVELAIPTGGVNGKVVDAATGAPLAGVAVYAASADPAADPLELATRRAAAVHTDANGDFHVLHLRSGRYVITAGATDLMASAPADHAVVRTAPLEVAEGQPCDAGTIRLPAGGKIEGSVVGGDGRSLSGATVFLRGADGTFLEEWTATSSDASGHFSYGGVPNGTWDVLARAPGHATAVARGVRVGEGSVASVRIALLAGTEVFADIGDVAVERLASLRAEVDGPDGRIPLTLFGLGDLTDLLTHPPRHDVIRLGRFGPGDYRVSGTLEGKSFERKFSLKGEPELHVPVELPRQ